ncbi:hypothetical protein ABT352_33435 [Streptosporangium sp. NPDC000563]|uniref:hypothetical protein n=1 Tax=Streptosporangium sp. NPDC000563 TaxID=3154366 RepID=UPI0033254EDC
MLAALIVTLIVAAIVRLAWPRPGQADDTAAAHFSPGTSPLGELTAYRKDNTGEVQRWGKTRTTLRRARATWRVLRAVSRFLNRHRVVLTPILVGVVVLTAGSAVYTYQASVWITAAASIAAAALISWRATRADALPVWLFTYPALGAAAWITASAVWPPHLLSLGIGNLIYAVTWWAHPVIRSIIVWQIRVQYWLAWWPHAMRGIHKPGVKVKKVTKMDPAGKHTVWRLQCPPGITVEQLNSLKPEIASAMHWPKGVIREIVHAPVRSSSQADMHRKDMDQSRILPVIDLPDIEQFPRSIYDPFLVGGAENSDVLTVRLATRDSGSRHVLLAGTTDEGKSTQLGDYLLQLFECDDVVLVGLDRKGCIEIRNGAHRMARIAQGAEEGTLLLEAIAAMADGAGVLIPAGHRVMQADKDNPAVVVVIDELARWISAEENNPRAVAAVETIITSGRAGLIGLIAATNSPSMLSLRKSEIRQAFDIIHLFHGSKAVWRNLIGEQIRHVDFTQLTGKGRHYLLDGRSSRPRLLRGYNNTARRVLNAATAAGPTAPTLHPLRAKAAGRTWETAPGLMPDDLLPFLSETQREEVFRVRAETPAEELRPEPAEVGHQVDPAIVAAASVNAKAARVAQAVARICPVIVEAGQAGFGPDELVKASGMSRSSVNRWLEALVAGDLVARFGHGRYRITNSITTANDLARTILKGR